MFWTKRRCKTSSMSFFDIPFSSVIQNEWMKRIKEVNRSFFCKNNALNSELVSESKRFLENWIFDTLSELSLFYLHDCKGRKVNLVMASLSFRVLNWLALTLTNPRKAAHVTTVLNCFTSTKSLLSMNEGRKSLSIVPDSIVVDEDVSGIFCALRTFFSRSSSCCFLRWKVGNLRGSVSV